MFGIDRELNNKIPEIKLLNRIIWDSYADMIYVFKNHLRGFPPDIDRIKRVRKDLRNAEQGKFWNSSHSRKYIKVFKWCAKAEIKDFTKMMAIQKENENN